MKLRVCDRILLFLGGLILAVFGIGIFLVSLRIEQIIIPAFGTEEFVINKLAILLCGLFLFVYAIYLLNISLSSHGKKAEFVVQETSGGELRISIKALDSLVRKVMATHPEMSLKEMSVENLKDNVSVELKIAIAENISIPLAVASVQKEIRQHLLSATGIDIKDVRISVDTADAAVETSPFIMHETGPIVSLDEEMQQETKKKHKLFSKKDNEKNFLPIAETDAEINASKKSIFENVTVQQQDEGAD